MKKIFIILSIFLISSPIFAQTTTKELEEVIVKEKKKTEKERGEFKLHAQSVKALTEEDLNRNNPAFIEQSLGIMAGVQVDKRTQLGGQRIVIRKQRLQFPVAPRQHFAEVSRHGFKLRLRGYVPVPQFFLRHIPLENFL